MNFDQDIDKDIRKEIRDICLLLEVQASMSNGNELKNDALMVLLSEADRIEHPQGFLDVEDLNIADMLHRAWARDQAVILMKEDAVLTQVCHSSLPDNTSFFEGISIMVAGCRFTFFPHLTSAMSSHVNISARILHSGNRGNP